MYLKAHGKPKDSQELLAIFKSSSFRFAESPLNIPRLSDQGKPTTVFTLQQLPGSCKGTKETRITILCGKHHPWWKHMRGAPNSFRGGPGALVEVMSKLKLYAQWKEKGKRVWAEGKAHYKRQNLTEKKHGLGNGISSAWLGYKGCMRRGNVRLELGGKQGRTFWRSLGTRLTRSLRTSPEHTCWMLLRSFPLQWVWTYPSPQYGAMTRAKRNKREYALKPSNIIQKLFFESKWF